MQGPPSQVQDIYHAGVFLVSSCIMYVSQKPCLGISPLGSVFVLDRICAASFERDQRDKKGVQIQWGGDLLG